MPSYRIHRLKRHLQQQFSVAPHVSGTANIKPRDYEPGPDPLQNPFIANSISADLAVTDVKPSSSRGAASKIAPAPPEIVEAPSPYAAFFSLRETGRALTPGDVLEAENGSLRIYKYVGFEEAQWVFAEPKNPFARGTSDTPSDMPAEAVLERGITA